MASSVDYVEFVTAQLTNVGEVTYRKMFGEYLVYVNTKPVLTICDNTCYVKMHEAIAELMRNAETGFPYDGAKLHYVLTIEDTQLCENVLKRLLEVTPIPKKKRKEI